MMDVPLAGVRELDLSACHANTLSDKINAVPGLRTSTAFFSFLRANLVLSPSAVSSCANSPMLDAHPSLSSYHHRHLAPTSPSPLAANPPLTPIDEIPSLSLDRLDSDEDKLEGLDLVADSIAEMRHTASNGIYRHPLCVAGVVVALQVSYLVAKGDMRRFIPLVCAMGFLYYLAVRTATKGYQQLAGDVDTSWLQNPETGVPDIVLGAKLEGKLVGTLVLRLQPNFTLPSTSGRRKKSGSLTLRGGRGIIRAWTTKSDHRGQDIGNQLLQAAVRFTKDKCGRDAEVGFAQQHVNSAMMLPYMFNGAFRKGEVQAAKTLRSALAEWDMCKRKR